MATKTKSKIENRKSSMSLQVHCSHQKMVAISELKPNPENPNSHPAAQVDKLAAIITAHGWRHPITVSNRSGFIVSGHCRLMAAEKLGVKQCPVDFQDFKSKAEERAVLVADNIIGEFSEMDVDKMSDIIATLEKAGYDLELTALTTEQIEGFLRGESGSDPADDIVPDPPKKAKTRTGDLYILGNHRLLCGDSTKKEDVERLMGGEKADMVFTDPPYGVNYDGGRNNEKKRVDIQGDADTDLYGPCCKQAFAYSSKGSALYLWHAGTKAIAASTAVSAVGYEIRSVIIWHKLKAHYGAFAAQYMQKHELCYYCYKKNQTASWYGPTNEVTVWEIEQPHVNEFHPTQKPTALATRAIQNSSRQEQIVLDGFLGSGSTIIAAEKLNRRCYGMEIDQIYCDVIVKRWQDFTGKKAKLSKK